jgi:hypothetical protein
MTIAEQIAVAILAAGFLATIVNRLIDALIVPIFEKYELDQFWLKYVSWIVGGGLVALTNINLFFWIDWRYPVIGYILTALVAGGGANFIADIFEDTPLPVEAVLVDNSSTE